MKIWASLNKEEEGKDGVNVHIGNLSLTHVGFNAKFQKVTLP
jgi:hypothetical protein